MQEFHTISHLGKSITFFFFAFFLLLVKVIRIIKENHKLQQRYAMYQMNVKI